MLRLEVFASPGSVLKPLTSGEVTCCHLLHLPHRYGIDMDAIFPELSTYNRGMGGYSLKAVLNVGWVDIHAVYPKGTVPSSFLSKLSEIMQLPAGAPFDPFMETIRELPHCEACGDIRYLRTDEFVRSNSELWIPTAELIYASPLVMVHHITDHGYCPPAEYIEAVLAVELDQRFDSYTVYKERLFECGWYDSVPT